MAELPQWKKVIREGNALGWIALFGIVVAIGVSTLVFGGSDKPKPIAEHVVMPASPGPN